jgi:hypothetical protein
VITTAFRIVCFDVSITAVSTVLTRHVDNNKISVDAGVCVRVLLLLLLLLLLLATVAVTLYMHYETARLSSICIATPQHP